MKLIRVMILFLICSCRQSAEPDFSTLKWQPIDSTYSIFYSKEDVVTNKNNRLQIQLVGYIDTSTNEFTKTSLSDSSISHLFQTMLELELKNYLSNKITKNTEGYIRTNLPNGISSNSPTRVYLTDNLKQKEIELMIKWLEHHNAVKSIEFVSKEKALRRYLDDSSYVEINKNSPNPLPIFFEVEHNQDFLHNNDREKFKIELMAEFSSQVADVYYPKDSSGITGDRSYIFHFKS